MFWPVVKIQYGIIHKYFILILKYYVWRMASATRRIGVVHCTSYRSHSYVPLAEENKTF